MIKSCKISFWGFLILFLLIPYGILAQDGSDSLDIENMQKEEILKLTTQQLFELPIDDLMTIVQRAGVSSVDELISLVSYSTSRSNSSIDEAPGIVTVITRDQIEEGAFRSIAEVLQSVAGIYIIQRQEGRFSLSIRGIKDVDEQRDYRSLTLVDGNPIFGIDESFPLDYIESIEIVRGPGSTMYGANAYAGIINIKTLDIAEDKLTSHLSVIGATDQFEDRENSNNTKRYHFLMSSHQKKGLDFMISATHYISDGYVPELNYHNGKLTNGNDDKKYNDIFIKGKYKNFSFYACYNSINIDAFARSKEGTKNDNLIETKYAALSYDNAFSIGEIKSSVYVEKYSEVTNFDQFVNTTSNYKQRKYGETSFIKINGDFQYNSRPVLKINHLTSGLVFNQHRHLIDEEFRYWASKNFVEVPYDTIIDESGNEIILTENVFDPKQQIRWLGTADGDTIQTPLVINSISAYIQDRIQMGEKVSLTLSLRHDWQEQYGHYFTYRSAFNWLITSQFYLKAQYGTAFRAPFVRETSVILENFEYSGNPDLEVEKVRTQEIQLGWSPNSKIRVEADVYHNLLENYIQPTDPYSNSDDKISTTGFECNVDAILPYGFSTRANFSYTNAKNKKDFPSGLSSSDLEKIEKVSLIPEYIGSFALTWKTKSMKTDFGNRSRFRVHVNSSLVGERKRPYAYDEEENEVVDIYHSLVKKSDAFENDNLKAYKIFNANLYTYLGRGFSLNFSIYNLGDVRYYSPPFISGYYDTEREGRNFQFSLKYEW